MSAELYYMLEILLWFELLFNLVHYAVHTYSNVSAQAWVAAKNGRAIFKKCVYGKGTDSESPFSSLGAEMRICFTFYYRALPRSG